MKKNIDFAVGFMVGFTCCTVLILSLSSIRDTKVIKMYTEGKIVCTTLADKFICEEVNK